MKKYFLFLTVVVISLIWSVMYAEEPEFLPGFIAKSSSGGISGDSLKSGDEIEINYVDGEEIITPTMIPLYKTKDLYKVKDNIITYLLKDTSFMHYGRVGDICLYVTYNGLDGYLDCDDVAYKSNGETSKVVFEDTRLFAEASFTSRELMDYILLNTEYTWEYNTDMKDYGWVKTTINGTPGWIFTLNSNHIESDSEESVKIREDFFQSIKNKADVRQEAKKNFVPVEQPVTEVVDSGETSIGESGNIEENNPAEQTVTPGKENVPAIKPKDDPKDSNRSTEKKIIMVCCVIIMILIIIIILLLRKNMWYKRRYRYGNRTK